MQEETDQCRKCGASAEYFHPEIGSLCEGCAELQKGREALEAKIAAKKAEHRASSELRSSEWVAVLRELTEKVEAFFVSCEAEGVKIPFLPCEVNMWGVKEAHEKAKALLERSTATEPNSPTPRS